MAWLCFSPVLFETLSPSQHTELSFLPKPPREVLIDWLAAIDKNPALLLQNLNSLRSPRLGIYYEALSAFYWQYFPGHQLLCKNLQVSHNKTTLGEFDFVVQTAAERYHLEVAVKFYLGIANDSGNNDKPSRWSQWIGPNCNDNLNKKLLRLRNHQLPLKNTVAAKQALLHQGITAEGLHSSLQLQGYLFYPAHAPLSAPEGCNPHHCRGLWCYFQDFDDQLTAQSDSFWLILEKSDWLAPAYANHDTQLLDNVALNNTLSAYFTANIETSPPAQPSTQETKTRPLLLARMRKDNSYWLEDYRCFVVPNQWPW